MGSTLNPVRRVSTYISVADKSVELTPKAYAFVLAHVRPGANNAMILGWVEAHEHLFALGRIFSTVVVAINIPDLVHASGPVEDVGFNMRRLFLRSNEAYEDMHGMTKWQAHLDLQNRLAHIRTLSPAARA